MASFYTGRLFFQASWPVNRSCRFFLADSQSKSVGLVWELAATSALSLHSSNEPGELSQWLCHDDSIINIISVIIVIIIIISFPTLCCVNWVRTFSLTVATAGGRFTPIRRLSQWLALLMEISLRATSTWTGTGCKRSCTAFRSISPPFCLCYSRHFLSRSTPPSRPNKVGLKCLSVRPRIVSSMSMKFGK